MRIPLAILTLVAGSIHANENVEAQQCLWPFSSSAKQEISGTENLDKHPLASIRERGLMVIFKDGSQWKVAAPDTVRSSKWKEGDLVTLSPCKGDYSYTLTNQSGWFSSTVRVTPLLGPIERGPLTNWIMGIDKRQGNVTLQNGVVFKVDPKEKALIQEWATNHTIIVGTNNSRFSSYKSILLNVERNVAVRAGGI
jgi:hypothetical protein